MTTLSQHFSHTKSYQRQSSSLFLTFSIVDFVITCVFLDGPVTGKLDFPETRRLRWTWMILIARLFISLFT